MVVSQKEVQNGPGIDPDVVVMRHFLNTLSSGIQQGFAARNIYVFTVKEKL
jgi:hypothetical protein